jgi:hypothetical protein
MNSYDTDVMADFKHESILQREKKIHLSHVQIRVKVWLAKLCANSAHQFRPGCRFAPIWALQDTSNSCTMYARLVFNCVRG